MPKQPDHTRADLVFVQKVVVIHVLRHVQGRPGEAESPPAVTMSEVSKGRLHAEGARARRQRMLMRVPASKLGRPSLYLGSIACRRSKRPLAQYWFVGATYATNTG